jgi:hypothetical protein
MRITELMLPERLDWFEETFTRLKERDSLHDLEYEMRRKDGTTSSVLVNVVAIKDTDGRFVRSHAISLAFESADAMPLAAPLAGQFVVLRMRPPHATSPLMRSYSLSAAPNASQYRVSNARQRGRRAPISTAR